MSTTNALKRFLSDEEILEVAEMATNGRILEASNRIRYLLMDVWVLSSKESLDIARKLAEEFK